MARIQNGMRPWRERFDALPANDKRALTIMVVTISAALIYLLLSSTHRYQQRSIEYYKGAREDYRWIIVNLDTFKQLGQSSAAKSSAAATPTDDSLIAAATNAAKPLNITFKRYQPEGDTGLRLWIEAGEFDKLLQWIEALSAQGVVLEQFDVDKLEKQIGLVDARVLLRRE